MRIDASQNLGLGVTPSAWGSSLKIEQFPNGSAVGDYNNAAGISYNYYNAGAGGDKYIANGYATRYFQTSGQHQWSIAPSGATGNTVSFITAMTLDNSGNLLVGTNTSDARIRANGSGTIGKFIADGGSYTGNIINVDTSGTAAGTGFNLILASAGGTNQFKVRGDGTIYAQNTSVQFISDVRIKENIVNAQDGLNIITALRTVRFDFKEGFGNNKKNQLGFIAQEIEAVFPEAVDVWGESDDPQNPYKSVGQGALIPVLVKAIQELSAQVTALQAKVGI